ncbi:thermonuclease family protein [Micrococcus terreus]|uniref:thermonuclease family protein n=1 Tax=Micrococcus terreus TaxID=574650 RepID=UPI00255041A6|nr:thermonuclease family protein [Micrococcus terreus]MDK7700697.1 thermonuclease family protein [Micrococcus terreus]WOO97365.1 thermonuclease family protein [Micrococcus terreus]
MNSSASGGDSILSPAGEVAAEAVKKTSWWKVGTGTVLVVGVLGAGGAFAVNQSQRAKDDTWATVVRVVDGDTFEGVIAGEQKTVRLLNVDTPETKHPQEAVQCLGPEATEMLKDLLEPGDRVKLEYDIERTDRYGRTLAGVFKDDSLVNADLARAGLGVAVLYEPNRKFYDEVREAQQEAEAAGDGLFDPQIDCTLPAHEPALAPLEALPLDEIPTDPAAIASALAAVAPVIAAGEGLDAMLGLVGSAGMPHLHAAYGKRAEQLQPRVTAALADARGYQGDLQRAEQAAEQRIAAEKKAAEKRAAEKKAAEKRAAQEKADAKKREAERAEAAKKAQAERERQAKIQAERRAAAEREAARQRQQQAPAPRPAPRQQTQAPRQQAPAPAPKPAPKPAPRPAPGGSGYGTDADFPGYTGPRCYAPGGQVWKPCG